MHCNMNRIYFSKYYEYVSHSNPNKYSTVASAVLLKFNIGNITKLFCNKSCVCTIRKDILKAISMTEKNVWFQKVY